MDMMKARRYLTEALHLSYGCTSATCECNESDIGTANMCRCHGAFVTMIKALNQMVEQCEQDTV